MMVVVVEVMEVVNSDTYNLLPYISIVIILYF
jgi:hypothetical protein